MQAYHIIIKRYTKGTQIERVEENKKKKQLNLNRKSWIKFYKYMLSISNLRTSTSTCTTISIKKIILHGKYKGILYVWMW